MPRVAPFETHHERYEAWFEKHEAAYISELLALRPFVPWQGRGIEIGVGSGRFAAPLGVQVGLDPPLRCLPTLRREASKRPKAWLKVCLSRTAASIMPWS